MAFVLVIARLDDKGQSNWTLVATSLVEAGLDLSFRTLFRERFSAASLIQIGGRGNRNFEQASASVVYDFLVSHIEGLKAHPLATAPAVCPVAIQTLTPLGIGIIAGSAHQELAPTLPRRHHCQPHAAAGAKLNLDHPPPLRATHAAGKEALLQVPTASRGRQSRREAEQARHCRRAAA